MKTLRTLTAASAIALAGSALAADLPSRRAPAPYIAPPPIFTWTGFYIGLNAGAAIAVNNNQNNVLQNAVLANALGVPFFGGFGNNGGNRTAFIGGGQLGYNWQSGPIVFGLEADAQYRSSFGVGQNGGLGGTANARNDGFLGTVRGRIGYAITPMFMIYATGGAAFGNTFTGAGFNPFLFGFGGNNNNNNFKVGYTIGGGLEYAFSPNWSVKAEYLFVDLGRSSQGAALFGFGGNTGRSQAHIGRLGVNYKFGSAYAAPVVAAY